MLKERDNRAIEALQKAQVELAHKCQERIDFINNQLRLERKAETKFTELNEAMREYHEVFGHELPTCEADDAYSIQSTWSCYWLDQFLTLALNILILSIFYISVDLSTNYFAHFSGC